MASTPLFEFDFLDYTDADAEQFKCFIKSAFNRDVVSDSFAENDL